MKRLRLSASASASALVFGAAIGLLVPATATAAPTIPSAPTGTTATALATPTSPTRASATLPDMVVGDQILRQLQNEFSANLTETALVERASGQQLPVGYTAHELTFRELSFDDESTAAQPWFAIFTFVLLDEHGCEQGGNRTLELYYDDAQTRTATIGAEAFAGDAPITLSPSMSFDSAATILREHLKQTDPHRDVVLDHTVLRQPSSPLSEFTDPLYVFHVGGDHANLFYAVDTRTGEVYEMEP